MVKKIRRQVSAGVTDKPKPLNIVFGFSQLQEYSYTNAKNDSAFFIDFLGRLKKFSGLDWNTVWTTNRHSFGSELISCTRLHPTARNLVPSEVDKLIVLRAKGDNHPFLGIREGNTFQVLFIEYQFGDIYNHG